MSLPTDFSAVESNDYSYLFYCRNGSTISFLKSSEKREGNKVTYASTSVRLGAELITTGSPRISAVTYDSKDKKTKEFRLYYIAQVPKSESYQLRELCRTDTVADKDGKYTEGKWSDGALNDNNIYCKKDSIISANVEQGKGDLKVFFMDIHGNPGIAWVVVGEEAWTSRVIKNVEW
ncbi:hypothetical protein F5B17DRAFT_448587 [Nemania serpens]|nr:hypothetical protein F5B17DRAFT_448587 [Nemania serpens]